MKLTNCIWEKKNLNRTCIEVLIEDNDNLSSNPLPTLDPAWEMVVVKCPPGKMEYLFELSRKGFSFMETQMEMSHNYSQFNFEDRFIKALDHKASFHKISSDEEIQSMLERISDNMFTTDRISLDPLFGPHIGAKRYRNWISNSLIDNTASLVSMNYEGIPVGFSLYRQLDDTVEGLVGGLFPNSDKAGLGILTPSTFFLWAHKGGIKFSHFKAKISSNNIPVLKLYTYLGFRISYLTYVFVWHKTM